MKRDLKRKGSSLKTAVSGKRSKPDIFAVVGLPVSQHRANYILPTLVGLTSDILFGNAKRGHDSLGTGSLGLTLWFISVLWGQFIS